MVGVPKANCYHYRPCHSGGWAVMSVDVHQCEEKGSGLVIHYCSIHCVHGWGVTYRRTASLISGLYDCTSVC